MQKEVSKIGSYETSHALFKYDLYCSSVTPCLIMSKTSPIRIVPKVFIPQIYLNLKLICILLGFHIMNRKTTFLTEGELNRNPTCHVHL